MAREPAAPGWADAVLRNERSYRKAGVAAKNLAKAEREAHAPTLFDALDVESA